MCRMPGMDGFAACSRIHQTRRNHLTPVIFVTGYDDLDSRAKAAASGGCGFVPKQVLASQITLVALSFILRGRLGRQIPALEAPPSQAGNGPQPASPELAGDEIRLGECGGSCQPAPRRIARFAARDARGGVGQFPPAQHPATGLATQGQ